MSELRERLKVIHMEAMTANQLPTRRVFLMLIDDVLAALDSLGTENADLRLDIKVAHRELQKVVSDLETLKRASIKLMKKIEEEDASS